MEKRSPFKTAAWLLVLVLIPIVGLFFYLFFGQEFRKQKMFSRRGLKGTGRYKKIQSRQLKALNDYDFHLPEPIENFRRIITLLLNNSNALMSTGNKVKILNNGEKTMNAIFKAMEGAKHHIHLEYYVICHDKTGCRLKEILIRKRKEGVKVRVIFDDVGSWALDKKYIKDLKEAGVEIMPFMEVRFPRLTARVNYRNHRKIVIVDGKTGFMGGVNIADRYIYGLKKQGNWRDTHIRIEGDAVASLQAVFAADWYFLTKENLTGVGYFNVQSSNSGVPMQISASGPDSDWDSIAQAFFAAIAIAKHEIFITTPYLMPTQQILTALKTAAISGVDVRIIIPENSDSKIPKWCSFSYVGELLEAGVRIFFYQSGFIHSKLIIVDDIFSTVGSANLDFRSLETNFEVNAFIYDQQFTRQLKSYFNVDMRNSREVILSEWKQRHWINKTRESLAYLVSPLF
ncbi:MAG: cardiolipin synthase [Prolixibacteraceae bacterium]|nr:cardiolipin synthase [Prolixibacteraceae bacterium]